MSVTGFSPLVPQGNLNRVLTSIVVSGFPQLTVLAPNMSKSLARVTYEEQFNDQIPTATGVVNSPVPFVMTQIEINLLRTQPVAALWIAQAQTLSVIGDVTVVPDVSGGIFPDIDLINTSIMGIDPGAYDGHDPTVKITIKGVFQANSALWSGGI